MIRFATVLLVLVGVAACAPRGPGVDPYPRVDGVVTYYERIALPRDAVVEVKLVETSDPRNPYVVGVARNFDPVSPPFPFAIDYNRSQIDPDGRYEIYADILIDNRRAFFNDRPYYVITDGYPDHGIEVVVRPTR